MVVADGLEAASRYRVWCRLPGAGQGAHRFKRPAVPRRDGGLATLGL